MTNRPSLFSTLIREAEFKPALEADEYEQPCDRCRRTTVWKLRANALGQQVYACTECGHVLLGPKP